MWKKLEKMKLTVKKLSKLQIVVYLLMIFLFVSVFALMTINYPELDFLGLIAEVLGFVLGVYLMFFLIPKWAYRKIKRVFEKNSKGRK